MTVAEVEHAAVRMLDGRHDGVDARQEAPGAINWMAGCLEHLTADVLCDVQCDLQCRCAISVMYNVQCDVKHAE